MKQQLLIELGLSGVTAIAVFWFVFATTRKSRSRKAAELAALLSEYAVVRGAGENADLEADKKHTIFEDRFAISNRKLTASLLGAGLKITAQEWLYVTVATGAAAALFVFVATTNLAVALVSGIASGFLLPGVYLRYRLSTRIAKFQQELPSLLQVLASSLRAGLSFQQALETAAANDRSEVGAQLRQALAEVRIGSDLEPALYRVADRMNSIDLRWLVSALNIQREVGGSLSGILDTVAATIKSRAEIKREIQVLSSEGRFSAYILIAMPFVMMLVLSVVRPGYMQFFFTSGPGIVLLIAFGVLMIVGWFWMKQLVKIEV